MSNLSRYASKKTGVPEEKLNFFGALLLALLPAKTQAAIQIANDAARRVEGTLRADSEVKP